MGCQPSRNTELVCADGAAPRGRQAGAGGDACWNRQLGECGVQIRDDQLPEGVFVFGSACIDLEVYFEGGCHNSESSRGQETPGWTEKTQQIRPFNLSGLRQKRRYYSEHLRRGSSLTLHFWPLKHLRPGASKTLRPYCQLQRDYHLVQIDGE